MTQLVHALPDFLDHCESIAGGQRLLRHGAVIAVLCGVGVGAFWLWVRAFAIAEWTATGMIWKITAIAVLAAASVASVAACVGVAQSPGLIFQRSHSGLLFVVLLFTLECVGLLLLSIRGCVAAGVWGLRGKRHPLW